ncbi:MAG: NTP transferase domain-containing protein [Anaerolineaceae bacterium]
MGLLNQVKKSCFDQKDRIAGVILAAGGSSRLGMPKQLLPWGKKNIINTCIDTARIAGLTPLVVVLGAQREEILPVLDQHGVCIVENTQWEEGQSSSIHAGLRALPRDIKGALLLLADQPQISVDLLTAIIETAMQKDSIVAPVISGRRANPVYFPARTFDALMQIKGDQGGRAIMSQYQLTLLNWQDDDMAEDIDTQVDYERMLRKFGLD